MARRKTDKWDAQAEGDFEKARKESITIGGFRERLCKRQAARLRRTARTHYEQGYTVGIRERIKDTP